MEQILPAIHQRSKKSDQEQQGTERKKSRPQTEQPNAKALTPMREPSALLRSLLPKRLASRGASIAGESQAAANLLQRRGENMTRATLNRAAVQERQKKNEMEAILQRRKEMKEKKLTETLRFGTSNSNKEHRKLQEHDFDLRPTANSDYWRKFFIFPAFLVSLSSLFRYKLALTPGLLANQAPLPPIVRGQERVREWPKSRNSLSLQLKTRQVSPVGNRFPESLQEKALAATLEANLSSFAPAMRDRVEGAVRMHAQSIPVEITFDHRSNYRKTKKSGARGIFHCANCLSHWKISGQVAEECKETAVLTLGPLFEMRLTDVARVANTLKTSERYVAEASVDKLLPILRRATIGSDRLKPVRTFVPKEVAIEHIINLGPQSQADFITAKTLDEEEKRRNHLGAAEYASAAKSRVLSGLPTTNLSWSTAVHSVGLLGVDSSFYPGFFTHAPTLHDHEDDSRNAPIADLPFLARGRIDDDGCYHKYRADHPEDFDDAKFPSAFDMMMSQMDGDHRLAITYPFKFAVQEGTEISLKEVFASGLWYTKEEHECYMTGVYNLRGVFIATTCFTADGYLLPGACDNRGRFIPFAYIDAEGNFATPTPPGRPPGELNKLLERIRYMPPCPKAQKLASDRADYWRIVRDGTAVDDHRQITVYLSEHPVVKDCVGGDDSLCMYIGGDVGPDKHLYPFGFYTDDGFFVAGGPPVCSYVRPKKYGGVSVEKPIWQIPAYKRRNRSKEKSPISGTATTVTSPGQSREKTDLTTKEKSNNVQQALPFLSSDKRKKYSKRSNAPRRLGDTTVTMPDTPPRECATKPDTPPSRGCATKPSTPPSRRTPTQRRNMSSGERIYNKKTEDLSKAPSVVFVHETDTDELAKLTSSRSLASKQNSDGAVNPAVWNKTGKPPLKPSPLVGAVFGMTKADDVAGTSQSNPLDVVSGTSFDSMKSADSYYDSDSTRKPSIESAPMAQSSGVNVEDVIATQATPFNLPPPPDPVKTGPDKIKPDSKSTPRRSRRKLSKAEKKQRRSLENSRRSVDSRSSVESVPKARKKSKEIPEKPSPLLPDSRKGSNDTNADSSSHQTAATETDLLESADKSAYDAHKNSFSLPILDGKLNVTDTYRFSYFAVPGHLKEYHQKIERGELQLPSVSAKYDKEVKEDIEERKRRRRDKSDLFRRIKMLEEMDSD